MNHPQIAPVFRRRPKRHWPAAVSAGVIATIGFPLPASAQSVADVQRELANMRKHYDAELKRLQRDYDARIRRLEGQLTAAQSKPSAAPPATLVEPVAKAPSPGAPPGPVVAEGGPAPTSPPVFTIGTPPREPWPIGPVTPSI